MRLTPPPTIATLGAALAALALPAAGCGSDVPEPPAGTATAKAAPAPPAPAPERANTAPVIDGVAFEPEEPVPGRPLRAVLTATDADGDDLWFEYAWTLDGIDAGERAVGADLDLREARKGQQVGLTVVASDGKGRSAAFHVMRELANRPPEIEKIELEPGREVVSGTPIVALPTASDPDGDPLTYTYAWSVGGRDLREEGALLETKRMRRGDEIRVRVTAHDGETSSEAVEMPPIVIVNGPPRVVSVPPSAMANGEFRYPVVAEDPDGDTHVEFRLGGAPAGMQIDPYSGLVTWRPTAGQGGVHTVTVFAEDLNRGVGQQEFEVTVEAPQEASSPAELAR